MSWFAIPESLTKLTGMVSSVGEQIKAAIDQAGASDQAPSASKDYDLGVSNCAPWVSENPELKRHEPELKALVMQITDGPLEDVLSTFNLAVPVNSDFEFDFEEETPRAVAAINAVPRLDEIRLNLVPSKMKDPEFFKRYFYKVSVVRQEFYKGIQLAHIRSVTASSAPSADCQSAAQAATSAGGGASVSQAGVERGQNDETKSADAHSSQPEVQVALASKSDLDDELDAYLA